MKFEWSNQLGSRDRKPWLLLVREGRVHVFSGENIPGVVAVVGTDYCKNGKWSYTTYRLELATGVRAIDGRDGWETGRFVEGLCAAVGFSRPIDRWTDVAEALGVAVPEAMRFLRAWRPKAAARLDEVDAALKTVTTEAKRKYVAILSTTVLPVDGVYRVETLPPGEIPDLTGVPHYIGHPATKEIVEGMGAVHATTKLFPGLAVGEAAVCFPITQGKSSRATEGFTTPHQEVTLEDLQIRIITRLE